MTAPTHELPMYDAFGKPTELKPKITYKLRVKKMATS